MLAFIKIGKIKGGCPMNQGLVRQINDIVRPYREARMGLLIVISNPVG